MANFFNNNPLDVKKTPTPNKYEGVLNINPWGGDPLRFNVKSTYQPLDDLITQRYSDITNFQSPFYAQYRKYLQSMMPKMGTNAMLAPLMAGNVDYGTAQKLGSMRAQEMGAQQNEAVNQGVQGFSLQAQGMANPLLNLQSSNYFSLQNLGLEQQKLKLMEDQMKYDRKWSPISSFLNMFSGLFAMPFANIKSYDPYGGKAGEAK